MGVVRNHRILEMEGTLKIRFETLITFLLTMVKSHSNTYHVLKILISFSIGLGNFPCNSHQVMMNSHCFCDQPSLMLVFHLGSGTLYYWLRLIEKKKHAISEKVMHVWSNKSFSNQVSCGKRVSSGN